MYEPLDEFRVLGTLQQDVRAKDVGVCECEAISEGVIDVRLCCEVHDGVNLFLLQDKVDKVGSCNVTLDESVVG
jgi:hypothetical protein